MEKHHLHEACDSKLLSFFSHSFKINFAEALFLNTQVILATDLAYISGTRDTNLAVSVTWVYWSSCRDQLFSITTDASTDISEQTGFFFFPKEEGLFFPSVNKPFFFFSELQAPLQSQTLSFHHGADGPICLRNKFCLAFPNQSTNMDIWLNENKT